MDPDLAQQTKDDRPIAGNHIQQCLHVFIWLFLT
jgi:hypothetical protein